MSSQSSHGWAVYPGNSRQQPNNFSPLSKRTKSHATIVHVYYSCYWLSKNISTSPSPNVHITFCLALPAGSIQLLYTWLSLSKVDLSTRLIKTNAIFLGKAGVYAIRIVIDSSPPECGAKRCERTCGSRKMSSQTEAVRPLSKQRRHSIYMQPPIAAPANIFVIHCIYPPFASHGTNIYSNGYNLGNRAAFEFRVKLTNKEKDWNEEDKHAFLERFRYKTFCVVLSQMVADDAFNAKQSPCVHRRFGKLCQRPESKKVIWPTHLRAHAAWIAKWMSEFPLRNIPYTVRKIP